MMTEYATYEDLRLLAVGSAGISNGEQSTLAGSLLKLPRALPTDVAAVLWPMSDFGNDLSEDVHQVFEGLQEQDSNGLQGKIYDICDALESAIEDPELAAMMDPGPGDIAEAAYDLNEVEVAKLAMQELELDGPGVTPVKLLLAMLPEISGLMQARVPSLTPLLEQLLVNDDEAMQKTTKAREYRQAIKIQEKNSPLLVGMSDMNHIEILEATCDDPDTLAVYALDKVGVVDNAKLFDLLQDADPIYTAQWLLGLTRVIPTGNQIEQLMSQLTDGEVRAVAQKVEDYRVEGHELADTPWLPDIIQHVYVPDVKLSIAQAVFVWDVFRREFDDDAGLWAAGIGELITSDEPIRMEDITI